MLTVSPSYRDSWDGIAKSWLSPRDFSMACPRAWSSSQDHATHDVDMGVGKAGASTSFPGLFPWRFGKALGTRLRGRLGECLSQHELKHLHNEIHLKSRYILKPASTSGDFEPIKNRTTTNKLSIRPQKGGWKPNRLDSVKWKKEPNLTPKWTSKILKHLIVY